VTIWGVSLAAYLAGLDVNELAAVLERRPEVLVEPIPCGPAELADRLGGLDSLAAAMFGMDADEMTVARTLALAGELSVTELANTMAADLGAVTSIVDRLTGRALAWLADGRIGLPERLAAHFAAPVAPHRPIALIARQMRAEDVRIAVAGLGGDPSGTKTELVGRLAALVSDPKVVLEAVARLSRPARRHLALLLDGGAVFMVGGLGGPDEALRKVGLLVGGSPYRGELPREVAVTLLLTACDPIVGSPDPEMSADPQDDGRAAAEVAVLALTRLLDAAAEAPLAALKKGGVGARERQRLARQLGVAEPALGIDIAAALDLIALSPSGYGATEEYSQWRDEPLAQRWAAAARAWFALEWAPTDRKDGDGEVAPPAPMASSAGLLRRALLLAAAGGRSLRAVTAVVDWFCPLHDCDPPERDRLVDAARREAELLGVVMGDRLTALGELLLTSGDLGKDAAELLPESRGMLVLQSDLSAVVSGQVSSAAARVLGASAVSEGSGAAVSWRFSPTSVRAAMDAGWTADALRGELAAVSGRDLPQPLEYLIGDVARRHGAVRVRETRCCISAAEAEIAEILHTRALAKLELHRLAPTVLGTAAAPDAVLAAMRKAGFAPMPEDVAGVVVVADRGVGFPAGSGGAGRRRRERPAVAAADLAARVLGHDPGPPESDMHGKLAALNPGLDSAEIALLVDALEHGRDVRIHYRNHAGNHSVRDIAPKQLWDRWITAYCYLRSDDRDFAVRGVEAVGPVG
jgi:Helicase conserved C-terminal domain